MNKEYSPLDNQIFDITKDIVFENLEVEKLRTFIKSPQNIPFFEESKQSKKCKAYLKDYLKQWEKVIELKTEYKQMLKEQQNGKY